MPPNFAEILRRGLSTYQLDLVRRVAMEAASSGAATYLVGGGPRDLVLGRPAVDLDLVVEGDAISLAGALVARYGGSVVAHHRFRTAKWNLGPSLRGGVISASGSAQPENPDFIDLTSARSEVYQRPAELPRVDWGNIDDDLRRRDFSINTLAVRVDEAHFGQVRDDFDALHDLDHGIVRVLHSLSFRDDPTRMYRAVRYEQRYGFHISPATLELMPQSRELVGRLSAQRIRHELDLILDEQQASAMIGRLRDLGLLSCIHTALPGDNAAIRRVNLADTGIPVEGTLILPRHLRWLLWLMRLSSKDLASIGERLHFGNQLFSFLLAAASLRRNIVSLKGRNPSQVTAYLRPLPLPAVYAVYRAETRPETRRLLASYLTEWRHVRPLTTGAQLKVLGLHPGPAYERILSDLRDARLDGIIHSSDEERSRLETLLRKVRRKSAGGGSHVGRRNHGI